MGWVCGAAAALFGVAGCVEAAGAEGTARCGAGVPLGAAAVGLAGGSSLSTKCASRRSAPPTFTNSVVLFIQTVLGSKPSFCAATRIFAGIAPRFISPGVMMC